jgi:hypothetical protein
MWEGDYDEANFIDPAGNQAQYTVYDAGRHNEYHWSTDDGDRVLPFIRASPEPGENSPDS